MKPFQLTTWQVLFLGILLVIIFALVSGVNVNVRIKNWDWDRFIPVWIRDKDEHEEDKKDRWRPFRETEAGDINYHG